MFFKKKLREITSDDFILKKYKWTEKSEYALTKDKILLKYEGKKTGFPIYLCLFEGYWEVTDIGIGYSEIKEAKPISELKAKKIMKRQEKPRKTRSVERNSWVS